MKLHLRLGLLSLLLRDEFRSPLSLADGVERLKCSTQEGDVVFGRSPGNDRKFIGHVGPDSFELRRDIAYQTTMLPILLGKLHANDGKLLISLRVGFYIAPLVVFLAIPAMMLRAKPLGVLLLDGFLLAISVRAFALELKRSVGLLREVLAVDSGSSA